MISVKGYNVCFLDLVTDSKTGKLSATKIWHHVGCSILSYKAVTETWWGAEELLIYGVLVIFQYALPLYLKWRYRDAIPVDASGDTEK